MCIKILLFTYDVIIRSHYLILVAYLIGQELREKKHTLPEKEKPML